MDTLNPSTGSTVASPIMRFLEVAACPICGSPLTLSSDRTVFSCTTKPQHRYPLNDSNFFQFGDKDSPDKYEDDDYVRQYIAYAYGYRLINLAETEGFVGTGQSEGLYRCVSQLVLSTVLKEKLYQQQKDIRVIDMACGLGRCVADIAIHLPDALIVGFDYSLQMIKYARDILLVDGPFTLDLRKFGFGTPSMSRFNLRNVFLAQADASKPPLRAFSENTPFGFDIVINSMLIDRIERHEGVEESIKHTISILKTGGTLIFTCPFNWVTEESWSTYGRGRYHILKTFEKSGIAIEDVFDGLVYRELLDPHGMHLELPVFVLRGRKER